MKSSSYASKNSLLVVTVFLTINSVFLSACLLSRSSVDYKVDSPIPSAKSYSSFENIPVNIDSSIGASTIKFNRSGDLLIGTNFGLVQIEDRSDKISHLKWSRNGDVVEQLGIDEFDGSVWFYNRYGGIIVNKNDNWQFVIKTEDFIKIRGDMFSRLEFVSVGEDFYLKTARSVLKLNRKIMKFEPFLIPRADCEPLDIYGIEYPPTKESNCLVTIGKFNNKLALALRNKQASDFIGNELSRSDFFDRIFIYENDKWNVLTDESQRKIKIKKIVNDEVGSVILLTDGSLVKLSKEGTLDNLSAQEKIVAIESSKYYGVLGVLQSGKVVSVRDNFRTILDLEQDFPNRFFIPIIDTYESKIAVVWKDEKNCIKVVKLSEGNKSIWQKCN